MANRWPGPDPDPMEREIRKEVREEVRSLEPRTALWGCGGLVIGAVIGAVVLALALFAFGPRPEAASPGVGSQYGNLSITMDDAYLTRQVSAAISQANLPIQVSNVQAEILPDEQVKISGDTTGSFPIGAHLEAVAQLHIVNGQLALHIINAQIGGLPLPASVASALEQPLNEKLQQVSAALLPPGYQITAISSTEHHLQMIISQGRGRPQAAAAGPHSGSLLRAGEGSGRGRGEGSLRGQESGRFLYELHEFVMPRWTITAHWWCRRA